MLARNTWSASRLLEGSSRMRFSIAASAGVRRAATAPSGSRIKSATERSRSAQSRGMRTRSIAVRPLSHCEIADLEAPTCSPTVCCDRPRPLRAARRRAPISGSPVDARRGCSASLDIGGSVMLYLRHERRGSPAQDKAWTDHGGRARPSCHEICRFHVEESAGRKGGRRGAYHRHPEAPTAARSLRSKCGIADVRRPAMASSAQLARSRPTHASGRRAQ